MTGEGQLIKVGLKAAILAVCLYAAMAGKYPPALAQPMSAEDATQDADIRAIDKHLEATDKNVADLQTAGNVNALAIAEMQGEARMCFLILGTLEGASIVLHVRKKKAIAE